MRVHQRENNLDTQKKEFDVEFFFGPYLGLQAELGESQPIFGISTRFCVEWATEHPNSPKSTFGRIWTFAPIQNFSRDFVRFWRLWDLIFATPQSPDIAEYRTPRRSFESPECAHSKVTDQHCIISRFKSQSLIFFVPSFSWAYKGSAKLDQWRVSPSQGRLDGYPSTVDTIHDCRWNAKIYF